MHDELRHLDEELAAGRVDADSYRRRRDDLLAARLPEPPAAPITPDGTEAVDVPSGVTEVDDTGLDDSGLDDTGLERDAAPDLPPPPAGTAPEPTGAQGRDPFPPPFRWGDAADVTAGDPSPDSTQVVAASLAQPVEIPPERTQVVPNAGRPAPREPRANGRSDGPADPTRVVGRSRVQGLDPRRAVAPGQPRPRPLAPPAAPVPPERTQFVPATALARAGERRSVPARRTAPPWADERSIPPPDARRQGREVFTRGTGPSAATVAGTSAVVLVVVVVLVLSFLLS